MSELEFSKRYIFVESSDLDFKDILDMAIDCIDEDYELPEWRELCSRKTLKALDKAAEKNEDLNRILHALNSPAQRKKMHDYAWDYISDIISYQISDKNRVYEALYGDAGTGKSTVALFMQLIISAAFSEFDDLETIFGFARTPSDVSDLLAEATERGIKTVLSFDEIEKQVGLGSRKYEESLLQNARTSRVLRHCVVMCSIERSDFGALIHHCDLLVRTMFKDTENGVNWCLLYTTEFDTNAWEPEALFAVPLIPREGLREIYENWKWRTQIELTLKGGMLSAGHKIIEVADNLIKFVKKRKYQNYSARRLREIVRTESSVGGMEMVGEQQTDVALRALRLLDEEKDSSEGGGRKPSAFRGDVSDLRQAILNRMIERGVNPIHVDALDYYIHEKCSQDVVALYIKKKYKMNIKLKQTSISQWLSAGEFVAEMGYSFEDVYSRYLKIAGISHIAGGGNEDLPDIVVFDEQNEPTLVLSLKCYADKRDVTSINRSKIGKKEIELSQEKGIPLQIIFFDMWTGYLHDPQLDEGQETFSFKRPERFRT